MEFTIDAATLSGYVNLVGKVVKAKSNLPILGNIYIKANKDKNVISLIGTDLEVQMVAEVSADVKSSGVTTVNSSLFTQYINSLKNDGNVHVVLDKTNLKVETEKSNAVFATRSPEDFPLFEDGSYKEAFSLEVGDFSDMVSKTIFSCAKDDIRPILTGVNVELSDKKLTFVSLDTFRLSLISTDKVETSTEKLEAVIPADALGTVTKVANDALVSQSAEDNKVRVFISKDTNFVKFEYANVSVFSRLLEGEYPNYKEILPKEYNYSFRINRQELVEALRRVGVFAQNAVSQRVVLMFKDGDLKLESVVPELGSVEEHIRVEGDSKDEFKIAFQLRFLLEIVTLLDDETLLMDGINKMSPVKFTSDALKDKFLHLLMPLKLED